MKNPIDNITEKEIKEIAEALNAGLPNMASKSAFINVFSDGIHFPNIEPGVADKIFSEYHSYDDASKKIRDLEYWEAFVELTIDNYYITNH